MTDPSPDPTAEPTRSPSPATAARSTQPVGTPDQASEDEDTTVGVLAALREEGITAPFAPGREPATIRCSVCEVTSPAHDFEVVRERRLEGTSDPDDMVLIVVARCPACHSTGVVVLGYGPEASDADADVVAALGSVRG